MSEGLDNIDKIFKDAFDGFEANVDPSVWTNVEQAIGSSGASDVTPKTDPTAVASGGMKAILAKVAVGVAVVGTVATTGYFMTNNSEGEDNVITENMLSEASDNDIVQEEITTSPQIEADGNQEKVVSIVNDQRDEVEASQEMDTPAEEVSMEIPSDDNNPSNLEELANHANSTSSTSETENQVKEQEQEEMAVAEPKEEQPKEVVKEEPKEEKKPNYLPPKEENPKAQPAVVDIIPNVITPNGDGDNDVIKISGENLEKVEVVIMDKTGKPVYRIKSVDDAWNGKGQNGYDLIPGVYYMAGVVVDDQGRTKSIKQTVNLFK